MRTDRTSPHEIDDINLAVAEGLVIPEGHGGSGSPDSDRDDAGQADVLSEAPENGHLRDSGCESNAAIAAIPVCPRGAGRCKRASAGSGCRLEDQGHPQ